MDIFVCPLLDFFLSFFLSALLLWLRAINYFPFVNFPSQLCHPPSLKAKKLDLHGGGFNFWESIKS